MRRGTTPTLTLLVNAHIETWTCYLTLEDGTSEVTFEDDRITKTTVDQKTQLEVTLTQEETLAMPVGNVEVQVRAIKNGKAIATNIKTLPIERILKEGVISE